MSSRFAGDEAHRVPADDQHVVVTGGTGFIGRHVVAAALARGWKVTLLGRRASRHPGVSFIPWDLAAASTPEGIGRADALIHLATDTRFDTEALSEDAEVEAARKLFAAIPAPARIVFISSQSSNPSAPARYGRVKARIEALAGARNGVVIRPGMVYGGDQDAGLHARLCRIVRLLPILPDLRMGNTLQPVHVDDLAQAILRSASPDVAPGTYQIGDPSGISMTAYLLAIARVRYGLWRATVPVPKVFMWMAARHAAPLLRLVKIDPQNILGLLVLKPMETADSLAALKLTLRPFRDGLRPGGRGTRRELLMEGHALLSYITRRPPVIGVLKRYVLAVEAVDGGRPLMLAAKYLAWPALLHLVENRGLLQRTRHPGLERRLEIAARVAEASTSGARQFMALEAVPALHALLSLVPPVAAELFWQFIRIGWRPGLHDHD